VSHYFEENRHIRGLFTNLIIINDKSIGDNIFFTTPPRMARNKIDILKGREPWCIGASMAVHRDIFSKYNHMPMVHLASDGLMAFRAIQEGGFAYIEKPTIKYRIHNNNLSQNLTNEKKIEWIKIRYMYYFEVYHNAIYKKNLLIAIIFFVKFIIHFVVSKLLAFKLICIITIYALKIKQRILNGKK
jgi:hypothetical protein